MTNAAGKNFQAENQVAMSREQPFQQQQRQSQVFTTGGNYAQDSSRRGAQLRMERDQCREHPEEEVNYFCFDCTSPPICSECVIHGTHQGHNVATLRKAYPLVMAKVEELALQLNSKVDELYLNMQRLESRKREIIDQTNAIKQQTSNAFEEIR